MKLFKRIYFAGGIPLILLQSPAAWAHGEEKPGPHGGFIRMPGGFHTELVPERSGAVRIFLLDMNFQDPDTQGSSVKALWSKGSRKIELTCARKGDYFFCPLTKGARLTKGELTIEAMRKGAAGAPAVYDLPLRLGK